MIDIEPEEYVVKVAFSDFLDESGTLPCVSSSMMIMMSKSGMDL